MFIEYINLLTWKRYQQAFFSFQWDITVELNCKFSSLLRREENKFKTKRQEAEPKTPKLT